jgi:hypothetical protein
MRPDECLKAGLKTMEERVAIHGGAHTYQKFGPIMQGLFPYGVTLETEEDWNRMGILMMLVHKLSRLSNDVLNPEPNPENAHDLGNYGFIMEAIIRTHD